MKKLTALVLLFALVLFTGCSKRYPIYTVQDFPTPVTLTLEQTEAAIMNAGQTNGWQMAVTDKGVIEGVYRLRGGKHVAVVRIPFTEKHYSILYKSSVNLQEKGDGKIHNNYNKLVQRLDAAIASSLKQATY